MGNRKILTMLVMLALVTSLFVNAFFYGPLMIMGNAADQSSDWDNSTKLNVTVKLPAPRIHWYDFQIYTGATWVSRKNLQMDIDNTTRCRFVVNVTCDYGWKYIEFINITAWQDNGSELTTYNHSTGADDSNHGKNRNFFLQYENSQLTSNTSVYRMLWPTNKSGVTKKGFTESTTSDRGVRIPAGDSVTKNLTFEFIPGYQFRHAPGDGAWAAGAGVSEESQYVNGSHWGSWNDINSWNFNITVYDNVTVNAMQGFYTYAIDEFGVYTYSLITSAGFPTIVGIPGQNATASPITVTTRSNGNYALSVNLSNLTHVLAPTVTDTISNETIWIVGGNLTDPTNFSALGNGAKYPIYLYGNAASYRPHEHNGTQKVTGTNLSQTETPSIAIHYNCVIPYVSAGTYRSTIRYYLETET